MCKVVTYRNIHIKEKRMDHNGWCEGKPGLTAVIVLNNGY